MKASQHQSVACELSELAPSLMTITNRWVQNPYAKPVTEKKKQVVALLWQIQVASKNLKGSAGCKLCQRNKIQSLIHRYSMSALFITLNPHDLSPVLLAAFGGVTVDAWRQMSSRDQAVFVMNHLDATACAFHAQMTVLLDVIVQYGKDSGLFGMCKAFYGTVEAQGHGTLHCHLLLWLEGNPNPQLLQDRITDHPPFRDVVFNWLEDIIKCELPVTCTKPV